MRVPIVFCLMVALTSPLEGQGLDSASVVLLKPDRFVRIQVPQLGRIQGNVGFISGPDLYLVTKEGSRTVSLAAVDTLWIRGRRTTLGAVIGGVIGLGGGIVLGLFGQAVSRPASSMDVFVPSVVAGTAAGALVGAVAGATFGRWRRVDPRD